MTKFACISDSHWGIEKTQFNDSSFHIQNGYPDKDIEIITALDRFIQRENIEFIIHCGDMIDSASPEFMIHAKKLFSTLSVPTYLCLGNHDLTDLRAHDWWFEHAPAFFPSAAANFSILLNDCSIHICPNQWGPEEYTWLDCQDAHLLDSQKDALNNALAENTDRPHFVVTHSPVHPMEQAQVGHDGSQHPSNDEFVSCFTDLNNRHPHLRSVISGHTHHNMHSIHNNCHYVSTSAFLEVPFECSVFTIDEKSQGTSHTIDMYTHSLADDVNFPSQYNFNKTQSQGRLQDRSFHADTFTHASSDNDHNGL